MHLFKQTSMALSLVVLVGCGGSGGSSEARSSADIPTNSGNTTPPAVVDPAPKSDQKIKINQLGFLPDAPKVAIVPNIDVDIFTLVAESSGEVAFQGNLSSALNWSVAGSELHKRADFSDFTEQGRYFLQVQGVEDSVSFDIGNEVYQALHKGVIKAYYYNRASTDISAPYADNWPRLAGHLDESVKVHSSAGSTQTLTGSFVTASRGWYDAGDYGKYVVNSGITTYTLLAAFEHFTNLYQQTDLAIPESFDQLPDMLNEILWNLSWLENMQDSDGGVFHKLTTLDWPGIETPVADNRDRYVIGKSTAAALNFAAVFAQASRIAAQYPNQLSGKSEQWLTMAISAWQWALQNPTVYYQQPDDVSSGEYGDNSVIDEFAWAAAELFISSENAQYFQHYQNYAQETGTPFWQSVGYLATSSLLHKGQALLSESQYQTLKTQLQQQADGYLEQHNNSAYLTAMTATDFVWGSNAVAMNKAMVSMQAYHVLNDEKYKQIALGLLDYVLGKNPTDYSFVTGFGTKTPIAPHHRISASDDVAAPIPGMLVGGPNAEQQDQCQYLSNEPAKSYLDDWCSYASNEVAINWNAPLVYVLASLVSD
ncbi:glycoside hydrolase family 9 protein [Thalassotalea sp. PLHSN55]|uniref:glycoside hydrolase family 9 protein n=1 Tax=Thalassotalea sp. PLHSN55 TaxID=3435888 RepID=UPI003F84A7AF